MDRLLEAPAPPGRLTRTHRAVRRAVLRRRRPLAAALTALAAAAGLQAVTAPPPATVTVAVAARDLPAGAVLGPGDLVPREFVPGSVPDDLAEDAVGRMLAGPLSRGEPLTAVRLVGPGLVTGRPDLVATPVRLPDADMVALLEVGDRVDLVAADPRSGTAEVLAAGVTVLAVPGDLEGAASSGLPGRLVVVGASLQDVAPLAEAGVRAVVTFTWATR